MTQGPRELSWLPELRAVQEMFRFHAYLSAYPFLALGIGLLYALLLPGLTSLSLSLLGCCGFSDPTNSPFLLLSEYFFHW